MNTKDVLSGVGSGAALGTEVYPGIGTGVGALIGLLLKLLSTSQSGQTPPVAPSGTGGWSTIQASDHSLGATERIPEDALKTLLQHFSQQGGM